MTGYWCIERAFFNEFDITASCIGYYDSTKTDLYLEEDDSLEVDFYLLHPTIEVEPMELSVELSQGEEADEALTIDNSGTGSLYWEIDSTESWLTVEPDSGVLASNNDIYIFVNFNSADLDTGVFRDTLIFTHNAAGGETLIPVEMNVVLSVGGEDAENLPREFVVESVYPNPFNSGITFNYTIPSTGLVSLTIINIEGRTVADLMNTMLSAGEHTLTWDASAFPAGIYLYSLEHGLESRSGKIILLK